MLQQHRECTSLIRFDVHPNADNIAQSNSATASALLGLLGIDLGSITGLIGLDCSPISVVGVGSGSACSGNTVNCSNGVIVRVLVVSAFF